MERVLCARYLTENIRSVAHTPWLSVPCYTRKKKMKTKSENESRFVRAL